MNAVFFLIDKILDIYLLLIFIWVIMSWLLAFGVIPAYNQFVANIMAFLHAVTEPGLRPIRKILPPMGGIDLSPLILILLIYFIQVLLARDIAPMFGVYNY